MRLSTSGSDGKCWGKAMLEMALIMIVALVIGAGCIGR